MNRVNSRNDFHDSTINIVIAIIIIIIIIIIARAEPSTDYARALHSLTYGSVQLADQEQLGCRQSNQTSSLQ